MKYIFQFLLFIQTSSLFASGYFQQQVNFKINVTLNDSTHSLHAHEVISYTNHSNTTLEFIYFHLWPNAYQKNTALDKQMMSHNDFKLHFAKDENKGFIDSLNFTVNGQKVRWEYDSQHKDICKVFLNVPLEPNETIEIETPFYVKIPSAKLSRLGRIGQFYAITQWYPKPAVFDADGWHQMPYLNQGEFYSEFGNFDVTITLPENYVVGSTGDLQTQTEIDLLNEKASLDIPKINPFDKKVNAFPASSKKQKTVRYTQQNIHDFGWFVDKRFLVRKSEVKLPNSGTSVTTWAMFTPQNAKSWARATEYINDAIFLYSKWNGDYPYKHCTAIDGTISAGGGMEYPNVTIINSTADTLQMDIVVTHEVGHNWFYGILGSNERLHPWMDEGINSFNEMRYVKTKYPTISAPRMVTASKITQSIFGLKKLSGHYFNFYSYWLTAMYNADQPIELPSEEFTSSNYGQIVYQKTAASFYLLYSYLGEEMFDKCMHKYFDTWKFKHPQPDDLRSIFETTTGKNLSWFFDDMIKTKKKIIIKTKRGKFNKSQNNFNLKFKNKGGFAVPVEVTIIGKDSTYTKWIEPFKKDTIVKIPSIAEKVIVDKDFAGMNLLGGNIKMEQSHFLFPHLRKVKNRHIYFFPHVTDPKSKNLFMVPLMGVNSASGIMPGVSISNGFFPTKKFEWNLLIMYNSQSYSFIRNWFPNRIFKRISLGLKGKSIVYNYPFANSGFEESQFYINEAWNNLAFIDLNYKTSFNSNYNGGLSLKRIRFNEGARTTNTVIQFTAFNNYKIKNIAMFLNFNIQNFQTIYDPKYTVNNHPQYSKINIEYKANYKISKSKYLRTRIFAGAFIKNGISPTKFKRITKKFGFAYSGNNDYTFSDTYFNRGYASSQTYINDGGVRNKFQNYLLGASNMLAFNSSIDILGNGLISFYFDIAFSNTKFPINDEIYYALPYPEYNSLTSKYNNGTSHNLFVVASGVRIAIIPDYVEFYVPFYLYETVQGKRAFKDTWKNVNVMINLTKLNPFDAARKAYD